MAQGLVFWRVGLYRGLWRFASVPDLWNIFKASFLGMVAIVLALALDRFSGVPMSVLVVYPFALSALLGTPRLLYRAWRGYPVAHSADVNQRVLILGAGRAAEALVARPAPRRVRSCRWVSSMTPASCNGAKIQGLPVTRLHCQCAVDCARNRGQADHHRDSVARCSRAVQRVVAISESTGLPFRMVPKLTSVLERTASTRRAASQDAAGTRYHSRRDNHGRAG